MRARCQQEPLPSVVKGITQAIWVGSNHGSILKHEIAAEHPFRKEAEVAFLEVAEDALRNFRFDSDVAQFQPGAFSQAP